MQRVLIFTNFINGLYNFRRELISELLNREFQVAISAPVDYRTEYFKELGCEIIPTELSRRGTNPLTDFKLLLSYRRAIREFRPDVVLTYTIKPNVYGGLACRLAGLPYLPNVTGLGIAVGNRGILQSITLFLYKAGIKDAACVFFQNRENADFFTRKRIVRGKQEMIPGSGVNLNHYQVLDYPGEEEINFLFIARIMKEKGIDQYLDTAAYIKAKYPNTRFHILGFCEEDYEGRLKSLQDKGIIQYHGLQHDVREFHKISHCTLHPTYYPEGMSNVLLESAACGRPVIATDRSGCREIVDDGVNGFLVEQKNTRQLIQSVERFLGLSHEEKRQMGLAGRAKVEREFDRQIVIDKYLGEINDICR
jgi:glycosyltransferase involved in cell wall biosynthesis